MNTDEYLPFAEHLANQARPVSLAHFGSRLAVDNKRARTNGFDPVTLADRATEDILRRLIEETFPEHGIWGEEGGEKAGRGTLTWVLDPIDGTRSYICGIPLWGTLIALCDGDVPILGLADFPALGQRFLATAGGPALGNGQPLACRPCDTLNTAMMMTTDPDMFAPGPETEAYGRLERTVRLRRFGGDCFAWCLLAGGQIDLVVEGDLQPYDIRALIPIIEASGGIVTTWDGGPATNGGLVVAAGDPAVHRQALDILGR